MAGLFSLGGGGGRGNDAEDQQHHHQQNEIPPPDSSLFWYSNKNHDDVVSSSYRGFEIWNQQQQHLVPVQPQPRAFFQQADLYTSAAALGVGPSEASRSGMSGGSGGGGGGGASCQDCGNQAKKDCPHVRCRTCCKSRGFDCQTHLKSTWVPASKRRERQQQQQQQQLVPTRQQRDHGHNVHNPTSSSLACTLLPPNPSHSGGLEEVNFPAVVSTPAEFKCVRVSSVDEADEEYAYSTAVNIGGHVFRGILYDHGPDGNSYTAAGAGSSSSTGGGVVQPLNLISAAGNTTAVGAIVDPSSLYPAPLNAFMPASGTQFFPHPRP